MEPTHPGTHGEQPGVPLRHPVRQLRAQHCGIHSHHPPDHRTTHSQTDQNDTWNVTDTTPSKGTTEKVRR
jgi:hypothetical protein